MSKLSSKRYCHILGHIPGVDFAREVTCSDVNRLYTAAYKIPRGWVPVAYAAGCDGQDSVRNTLLTSESTEPAITAVIADAARVKLTNADPTVLYKSLG